MPRAARIVVPGASHHITQRGNNQYDVFFVPDDRRVYLEYLREQGARFGFRLEGYCLMTNHIHLIGVPAREDSVRAFARFAKAVGRTHFLYTQYVNRMHGRTGHLWGKLGTVTNCCALDGNGNITAVDESWNTEGAWDYTYDNRQRLTAAVYTTPLGHQAKYNYTYNDGDNLVTKQVPFEDDFDDRVKWGQSPFILTPRVCPY